jgi:hypothetical protein
VLVSLNMTAHTQSVSPGLAAAALHGARLHTLLSSPAALPDAAADARISLPPFAAWVALLR